ncbi:Molybdenum cofactor biosynthesis protein [uncultured Thiomicrorhabdus sp.]
MPKLIGIATHQRSRGEIRTHREATLNCLNGLGDYRGNKHPKTSVTILSLTAWEAACNEASDLLPLEIDWTERRANLLVDDIDFSELDIGRKLQIGQTILQVTRETDPCLRMDGLAQGLKAALKPNWRGGARCEVIQGGKITLNDKVIWLEKF